MRFRGWAAVTLALGACGSAGAPDNADGRQSKDASVDAAPFDAAPLGDSAVDDAGETDGDSVADGSTDAVCPALNIVVQLSAARAHGIVTVNGDPLPPEYVQFTFLLFSNDQTTLTAPLDASDSYDLVLPAGVYDVSLQTSACPNGPSQCYQGPLKTGVALRGDVPLELDLSWSYVEKKKVDFTGSVTLNGAPVTLPDGATATIEFRDTAGVSMFVETAPGGGTFAASLVPGVYRVSYHVSSLLYGSGGWPFSGDGEIATQMVTPNQPLMLAFESATLEGRLTLNGGPWSKTSGQLRFNDALGVDSVLIAPDDDGHFSVTLSAGQYDVEWSGDGEHCGGPAPCSGSTLRMNVEVEGATHLDLDVPAIHVRGMVTVNGMQIPDASNIHGTLLIGDVQYNFGAAGPAMYDMVISPGEYSLYWTPDLLQQPRSDRWYCNNFSFSSLPCNEGTFGHVSFLSDELKDIDIPVARVHGVVTVNGHAIPDEGPETANGRGVVIFSRPDSRDAEIRVASAGQAGYDVALLGGGPYDQFWDSTEYARCEVETALGLPCSGAYVRRSIMLSADAALDVALKTFRVSGRVTLEGDAAPVPNTISFNSPGGIAAVPGPRSAATFPLISRPDGLAFDAELLEGTYLPVVSSFGKAEACVEAAPQSAACNGAILTACPE